MSQNFIFAKVKRKQNLFRVFASDVTIYALPNLTGIEYDPSTLIGEDELYKLSNFSTRAFSVPFLLENLDSVNYDQITKADFRKISYICAIQGDHYFFQVINASYYISKKWFSIEELRLEVDKPIITINTSADAVYDKQNDTLYFKKLSVANRIFKGMDQLYRSATDHETEQFLESEFLEINNGFNKDNVSIPNRKRIALVTETLNNFTEEEKQAIYDYTNLYGRVTYNGGKFKIETDDDLKFVLWGIEQRFYTTPIGGEKRVANSVIQINFLNYLNP